MPYVWFIGLVYFGMHDSYAVISWCVLCFTITYLWAIIKEIVCEAFALIGSMFGIYDEPDVRVCIIVEHAMLSHLRADEHADHCIVHKLSSRMCQHGTKSCTVDHV